MKRHLVVATALLVLVPSLLPAQELILHERKINRQRITTIACVPARPGMMMPAPGMIVPPGAGVPVPGAIVPAPGNVQPAPGAVQPAPGAKVPPGEDERRKLDVSVPATDSTGAAPAVVPTATAVMLDSTAWLDDKSFIDGQGRCWQQASGQPYSEQPIAIGGLLLRTNDGSLQFFTSSGRLFRLGLHQPVAKQAPAGQGAAARCSTGRCAGGQCRIR